jgi:hypothetical protein
MYVLACSRSRSGPPRRRRAIQYPVFVETEQGLFCRPFRHSRRWWRTAPECDKFGA